MLKLWTHKPVCVDGDEINPLNKSDSLRPESPCYYTRYYIRYYTRVLMTLNMQEQPGHLSLHFNFTFLHVAASPGEQV